MSGTHMDREERYRMSAAIPVVAYCDERRQLSEDFALSVRELMNLHQQQLNALISGDEDFARFDILIHMANERKRQAKYSLISHIESHHC